MAVILETPRLLIREWELSDCNRLYAICSDPRVMRYIGDGALDTEDKTRSSITRFIEFQQTRGWVLWAVEHKTDRNLIGFCGFGQLDSDIEIGWRLAHDYWRQGLCTEAARMVLAHGFNAFRFPRVVAIVQPANRASIRVMEKIGMVYDGPLVRNGIDIVRYVIDNPALAS